MNLEQAKTALERAVSLRLPVMLWGPPGVGKSSLVRALAVHKKVPLIDLRLAQLDAADLRGIPVPDKRAKVVHWYAPAFLPTDGEGLLFLDEMDKAPALVKNAALQLVLDRRLGDYELPHGWAVVGAGNREEDDADSSPLGSALANRMLHLEIEPDGDAWQEWAKFIGVHSDIRAFLRFRPELLYKQTGEPAFPSPRSWTVAARLLEGVEDPKERFRLLASAVGPGTASEFAAWRKVYRAVDVDGVLRGWLPDFPQKDASFRYAVVLAVASRIEKNGLRPEQFPHVGKLMGELTPELRVLLLKSIPSELVAKLAAHPAVRETASKLVMDYVGG